MLIVGIPLCLIVIGWALVAFWYLWTIVRCIKGLKYLMNNQVHPKPAAWGFG
jgi:uncharacterized membrane protein